MKTLNLRDSIYQRNGSKMGLCVNDGMLINNAPDSTNGIQKLVQLKKSMKKAEKIATMSEAISIGNMRRTF